MIISVIIPSPPCGWKFRSSFVAPTTFLELHSTTELQHSPKQLVSKCK